MRLLQTGDGPTAVAWSQLLRRVFAADLLTCEKCGERRG